jgi:hypothetical protein
MDTIITTNGDRELSVSTTQAGHLLYVNMKKAGAYTCCSLDRSEALALRDAISTFLIGGPRS